MDLDFSILQQKTQTNKVQNIVAPLLEKTRGKAALFPPPAKSLQAYCMCSRQKVEVEMPGGKNSINPEGAWAKWVGVGRFFADFFSTGRIFGYNAFCGVRPKKNN